MKLTPLVFFLYVLLGIFVGLFSGLFGVGGGIIMVPVLVLVSGYTQQIAQGISLAVMVPTALGGALQYAKGGNMKLWVALAIAIGAVPAAYFYGASIAQRLPEKTLRAMFALFMVAVAARVMPSASPKSMGALFGMAVVAIGVRMVFAMVFAK